MGRIAIANVLVFDGEVVTGPTTVVMDEGVIQSDLIDAKIIDGTGCMILPGLIDCHVHVKSEEDLKTCSKYGVTTVCDLGAYPKQVFEKLKAFKGAAEYLSSGLVAYPPGGIHARLYESLHEDMSLKDESEVADWVEARVSEGVDFLKIIGDESGFDQSTLNKIAAGGRAHGKLSIVHAADIAAYQRALNAKCDMVTHTPVDAEVSQEIIQQIATQGTIVIPTLFVAQQTLGNEKYAYLFPEGANFKTVMKSVRMMHRAGIPILAGTDSNSRGMGVNHGEALHEELALLVQSGMTPIDALKAATSSAARYFKLKDRGRIASGLRADLILVEGDPTKNIADVKNIKTVWNNGVEFVWNEL